METITINQSDLRPEFQIGPWFTRFDELEIILRGKTLHPVLAPLVEAQVLSSLPQDISDLLQALQTTHDYLVEHFADSDLSTDQIPHKSFVRNMSNLALDPKQQDRYKIARAALGFLLCMPHVSGDSRGEFLNILLATMNGNRISNDEVLERGQFLIAQTVGNLQILRAIIQDFKGCPLGLNQLCRKLSSTIGFLQASEKHILVQALLKVLWKTMKTPGEALVREDCYQDLGRELSPNPEEPYAHELGHLLRALDDPEIRDALQEDYPGLLDGLSRQEQLWVLRFLEGHTTETFVKVWNLITQFEDTDRINFLRCFLVCSQGHVQELGNMLAEVAACDDAPETLHAYVTLLGINQHGIFNKEAQRAPLLRIMRLLFRRRSGEALEPQMHDPDIVDQGCFVRGAVQAITAMNPQEIMGWFEAESPGLKIEIHDSTNLPQDVKDYAQAQTRAHHSNLSHYRDEVLIPNLEASYEKKSGFRFIVIRGAQDKPIAVHRFGPDKDPHTIRAATMMADEAYQQDFHIGLLLSGIRQSVLREQDQNVQVLKSTVGLDESLWGALIRHMKVGGIGYQVRRSGSDLYLEYGYWYDQPTPVSKDEKQFPDTKLIQNKTLFDESGYPEVQIAMYGDFKAFKNGVLQKLNREGKILTRVFAQGSGFGAVFEPKAEHHDKLD